MIIGKREAPWNFDHYLIVFIFWRKLLQQLVKAQFLNKFCNTFLLWHVIVEVDSLLKINQAILRQLNLVIYMYIFENIYIYIYIYILCKPSSWLHWALANSGSSTIRSFQSWVPQHYFLRSQDSNYGACIKGIKLLAAWPYTC